MRKWRPITKRINISSFAQWLPMNFTISQRMTNLQRWNQFKSNNTKKHHQQQNCSRIWFCFGFTCAGMYLFMFSVSFQSQARRLCCWPIFFYEKKRDFVCCQQKHDQQKQNKTKKIRQHSDDDFFSRWILENQVFETYTLMIIHICWFFLCAFVHDCVHVWDGF